MPIKGAHYRVKTTKKGVKVRLAWVGNQVVEAKNLKTGDTAKVKPKKKKRVAQRGKKK
jgi:hypothetical protein